MSHEDAPTEVVVEVYAEVEVEVEVEVEEAEGEGGQRPLLEPTAP